MKKRLIVAAMAVLFFSQCGIIHKTGVHIPRTPHESLKEYNFFIGAVSDLSPNEGVLPYDLNSPLFTDYAQKARFVWMPEGTSAAYTTDHVLEFPEGAVLIKNFYYFNNEATPEIGKRILETRLLINRGNEWEAVSYIWNDEQTDARREIIGDITEVSWKDEAGEEQNIHYIIPNINQCKGCHGYDNKQMPIGPKIRNLNKDFAYADGTMNQLEKWAQIGYLAGYNRGTEHPSVAAWDNSELAIHDRAMAYLDINCGHCHNPKGAANTSGLTLLADSEIGTDVGVYKPTVSAGAGTGGHTYSVVPGNPDESIMIYRMKSTNPGAMMPELGRSLVHEEGVHLIEDWIRQIEPHTSSSEFRTSLN